MIKTNENKLIRKESDIDTATWDHLSFLEKEMTRYLLSRKAKFYIQYEFPLSDTFFDALGKKYYRVDFLLPEYGLIIETDGSHHREEWMYQDDRNRDNFMACVGLRTMRFNWSEITSKNTKSLIWNLINSVLREDKVKS